jgi:gamma-glutamyl phosphate reductase
MINRLILTSEKIDQLSQDVEKIAQMPDPLNQELEIWDNPSNGLRFSKVSVAN